jgi:hypothetical protein
VKKISLAAGTLVAVAVVAVLYARNENGGTPTPTAGAAPNEIRPDSTGGVETQRDGAAFANSGDDSSVADFPKQILIEAKVASGSLFQDVEIDLDTNPVIREFVQARPAAEYRIVNTNIDELLENMRRASADPSHIIEIQLLNNEVTRLSSMQAQEHASGWQAGLGTWRGSILGDETSSASFTVSGDGRLNGYVRSAEFGRIKVEPIQDSSFHLIWLADPNFVMQID